MQSTSKNDTNAEKSDVYALKVVSDDPTYPGFQGLMGPAAARGQSWSGGLALMCGSPRMVTHAVSELQTAGNPHSHIRYGTFTTLEGNSSALVETDETGERQ